MPGHALAHDGDLANDAATNRMAGGDYLSYLDILRALDGQGAAVNSALLEAHTAYTSEQRQTALTTLHSRLRDMAATANDALGNWPVKGEESA
jgi:hypothetical protein